MERRAAACAFPRGAAAALCPQQWSALHAPSIHRCLTLGSRESRVVSCLLEDLSVVEDYVLSRATSGHVRGRVARACWNSASLENRSPPSTALKL